MNNKSKGMGLGIALGVALGTALGVMAGHAALWIGVGVAIGMAIGSTLRFRRSTCANCETEKRNQELGVGSQKLSRKGVHDGTTGARFHVGKGES